MSKLFRIFLTTVCSILTIIAYGQEIRIARYVGTIDDHATYTPEVTVSSEGNNVLITCKNVLWFENLCGEISLKSTLLQTNYDSHSLEALSEISYTDYNNMVSVGADCIADITLTIPAFKNGLVSLSFNMGAWSLKCYINYLTGKEYSLPTDALSEIREDSIFDREWVVSSIRNKDEKADFFRLRIGKDAETVGSLTVYPVLMCQGEKFDTEKATTIAKVNKSLERVFACDVEIPSTFWGEGISYPTINPLKWPCYNGMKVSQPLYLTPNKTTDNYFNYYNFLTERYVYVSSLDYSPVLLDREVSFKRIIGNVDADQWQGEWIDGIGAVGDWYASNLPYPIYQLPEGVCPARVLYIRDLNTQQVAFGDDTLDPASLGVADITTDGGITISEDHGILRGNGYGPIEMKMYTSEGHCLFEVSGTDTVGYDISDISGGVYIVVATTNQGEYSKKLIK